ncbi:MAG: hypothetical protein ACXVCT_19060 [Ktedonobacterales bacterium]
MPTSLIVICDAVMLRIGREVAITEIEGELADVDLSPRLRH